MYPHNVGHDTAHKRKRTVGLFEREPALGLVGRGNPWGHKELGSGHGECLSSETPLNPILGGSPLKRCEASVIRRTGMTALHGLSRQIRPDSGAIVTQSQQLSIAHTRCYRQMICPNHKAGKVQGSQGGKYPLSGLAREHRVAPTTRRVM